MPSQGRPCSSGRIVACLQGTQQDCRVPSMQSCPVHWFDAAQASKICIRPAGADWDWSRGFSLDNPGDMFIKIRSNE